MQGDRGEEPGGRRGERERQRRMPVELLCDVGESDRRHQRPDPVPRTALPGDQACGDPDAVGRDLRELLVAPERLEAVRERDQYGSRTNHREAGESKRDEEPPTHGASDVSRARAGPDSSSLWMKPRADVRCSRCPKSAASRLEVSTTTGLSPFPASRSATANPSVSGSTTSKSTSSGRSSSTAASAEAPSSASPTTV